MSFDRRRLLSSSLAAGAAAMASTTAEAGPRRMDATARKPATAGDLGLVPDSSADQTAALQAAIDAATARGVALSLPPGRFLASGVRLRAESQVSGHGPRTVLAMAADGPIIVADKAHGARLRGLALHGGREVPGSGATGLLMANASRNIRLTDLELRGSRTNGMVLTGCSGAIRDCDIGSAALAGLLVLDSVGLAIGHNRVADCANNGILVWRSKPGEDGTTVINNRIERIAAAAGGSGQNGNGINVYRAGDVLVSGNRITDCAYTAIRGNAASNIQMVGNHCQRLGEVALYAEFGFEGALIASNIVDGAATGISVTNFNEGGRLAVIQGNLVRNLHRREHETIDKRGEGIGVEADAVVTGNTIEGAPTAGIVVGWGKYMREVAVTSNVIRRARVGIMVTRDPEAGAALISQNLISGTREGGIRAMDKGVPVGPDLARSPPTTERVQVAGNLVVGA